MPHVVLQYTANLEVEVDMPALCREIGENERVVAIAWVLANPAVSSAIVGIRTVAHLDGLDRAAELRPALLP